MDEKSLTALRSITGKTFSRNMSDEKRRSVISANLKDIRNEFGVDDAIGLAYLQMNDGRQCVSFSVFHSCVEIAVGRPVYNHEFGLNYDELKRDVDNAWNRMVKEKNAKQ